MRLHVTRPQVGPRASVLLSEWARSRRADAGREHGCGVGDGNVDLPSPCHPHGLLAVRRAARAGRRPGSAARSSRRGGDRAGRCGQPARDRHALGRVRDALDVLRERRAESRHLRRARLRGRPLPADRALERRPPDRCAGLVHAAGRPGQAHPARGRDLLGRRDPQGRRSGGAHVRDVQSSRLAQLRQRRRRARCTGCRRQWIRRLGGHRGGARARAVADARHGDLRLLRLRGTRAVRQRASRADAQGGARRRRGRFEQRHHRGVGRRRRR